MKICFITEDFYPNFIGGQGVYGYHMVSEFAMMGHQVWVLMEKRGDRAKFWRSSKNVHLIEVPFCFGNKLILSLLEYLFFLYYCRKDSFDIIHLNGLSGLLFTIFKPKNAGKVIMMDHNTNYEMNKETQSKFKKMLYPILIFLERILFKKADGILFNNPQEERSVKKYYKIDQKTTESIYLGVEPARFSLKEQKNWRLKLRNQLGIPLDAKIVLYVGRLVERKNVDILIRALTILREIATLRPFGFAQGRQAQGKLPRKDKWGPEYEVYGVIVGDGPQRKRLEEMAPDYVKFLGWDTDTKKYYLAADCFVTVSVAEGGFLLTALEAAIFGLPLILSKSAAGFPIIKESVNGFIVDPNNPRQLADKIKKVIGDEKMIGKMGEESRRLARRFSWERCARETVDFYEDVILRAKPEGSLTNVRLK